MRLLRFLLFPFAVLYGWVMALRNVLYDRGWLKSTAFAVPVIAVGNLTVGGTGKTPHVEYLLRLLHSYKRAALSRGYGRRTKGFVLAGPGETSLTLGDEPFQYHADFPEVTVAVCEDRVAGIRQLLQSEPKTEVVLLDDALQHRPVRPGFSILITDFNRIFARDFMMPTGLLREHRSGAKRAQAVVVSKCPPHLSSAAMDQLSAEISRYTRHGTPVFFSAYRYGAPVAFGSEKVCGKKVMLVTGIANPLPLKVYLQEQGYEVVKHLSFPDHHAFQEKNLLQVEQAMDTNRPGKIGVITTRKDAVRLLAPQLRETVQAWPIFYVPIQVQFLREKVRFDQMVLGVVRSGPSQHIH